MKISKLSIKENLIFTVIICILVILWLYAFGYSRLTVSNLRKYIERELQVITAQSEIPTIQSQANTGRRATSPVSAAIKNPFVPIVNNRREFKPIGIFSGAMSDSQAFTGQINPANLTLTGIMKIGNVNYAIINDYIVKEGDSIFGVSIFKITDSSVSVVYNENVYRLNMKKSEE